MHGKLKFSELAIALLGVAALAGCAESAGYGQEADTEATASAGSQPQDSLLRLCGNYQIKDGPRTGVYRGGWREGEETVLDHTLAILEVEEDGDATVLYAHGAYPPWDINSPNCVRRSGKFIDDETLRVEFPGNMHADYYFVEGMDTVNATYTSSGGVTRGQVKKEG